MTSSLDNGTKVVVSTSFRPIAFTKTSGINPKTYNEPVGKMTQNETYLAVITWQSVNRKPAPAKGVDNSKLGDQLLLVIQARSRLGTTGTAMAEWTIRKRGTVGGGSSEDDGLNRESGGRKELINEDMSGNEYEAI
ncbi:hypothetical protein SERLA73DRAFT_151289 [Serpula lacrymans var. lacrymans S7.3]|uniref:Uncharacterized protein n=1 Tax=Serpula lacrymans var. lacrymans (strain S7.3) TaxID=936435 RepID=F8PTK6_SERL3|nr:hypothetical protein SERLA73DRAFT_151289 [Serpula lacrymans var. lacrymans S7.3]